MLLPLTTQPGTSNTHKRSHPFGRIKNMGQKIGTEQGNIKTIILVYN
jgi:hypothetical protein